MGVFLYKIFYFYRVFEIVVFFSFIGAKRKFRKVEKFNKSYIIVRVRIRI